MTDLDTLARAATQELLERTTPDVRSRYADLRRIRARRTTAKVAAVGVATALAIGGWQLAGPHERSIEPAPQPHSVRNGTLLGLPGPDVGPRARWVTVSGEPLGHLPEDAALFAQYQFTAAGTEIVYADRRARISAVDVTTGETRTLLDCPDDVCAAAVSPDLETVAWADGESVWLTTVGSGATVHVSGTDVGAVGAPSWAPDGHTLAFVGGGAIHLADLDSGEVSRVSPQGSEVTGPIAWSPDGRSLAYFVTTPARHPRYDTAFTATVLDLATASATPLLDAGHCGCGGLPQPTLTWSPDGRGIAVTTTKDAPLPWGVYLVPPGGGDPERIAAGVYAALAWQPLRG